MQFVKQFVHEFIVLVIVVAAMTLGPIESNAEEQDSTVSSVITGERSVRVAKLSVGKGDKVKKGDVLAVLSTQQLEADKLVAMSSLEEAKALVKVAKARLAGAKLVFDRQAALKQSVSFRRADFEDAEVALQLAESNLALAESTVNRQKAEVDRIDLEIQLATIRAPFEGSVVKLLTNVGATVTQRNPNILVLRSE